MKGGASIMGREYSSDLSGLRDELINGLAALRKEVQKESEKVGRAIGDGYEDGYEDSVEVVRKSKEDLLQELQDLQGAFERNLNKLPTILKKSFQKLDFADLSRVSRRLKTEISEIQNIYGDLSKIGVDININGWMDSMLQKANQLSVSLDQQSEIVSDIGKAAEDAADKVVKGTKESTAAIQQQAKATEQLAKARKKASGVKVREFTREEYDAYTEQYQKDHDGDNEFLENTVDIIRKASQFGTHFAADIQTSCKRAATAVNRFFSAIDPDKYPALASWKETILESVQNGISSEKEMYNGMFTGAYSWGVEAPDEDSYYVYLNLLDVAKDKEKEYFAYLQEEYRKRDEGLEKQHELTRKLVQTYEKLNELHKNEPNWDNNNQIESIKKRLTYYEQEKVLLQDIQNIKEEFDSIPSRYKNPEEFNETARVFKSTLKFGDYGNGNLKDNERATSIYQRELESAIKKQEKLTAAIEETANARQEETQFTQKNVAAMAQLQNLIGDLKSKYGEQSFNNIFGETVSQFGELNASNATALYDALITKNEEYIRSVEEQAQKTRIAGQELQTFMAQNQKLANQFGNNVEFEQKWCDLLNQIGQATLNAADATKQLSEWMDSSGLAKPISESAQQQEQFQKKIEETTGDIEKQNKELGKTADIIKSVFDGYKSPFSDVEMKQLLKGANLNNILSGLNISKANKAEITNKYNQLASMWADQGNVEESVLYAATQEFVDLVVSSSTRRIENVTQEMKDKAQEFLNYMNGKQFSYSAADRAEFGSDWAAASKVALGKNQKLLSNKSGTPLTGSRYTEILDVYNKLIGAAQEIDQKQNQLQQIVKMVSNAKNLAGAPSTKSIDLTAEDSAALYDKVSASMSVASNNAEQMRIVAAEAVKKEEELAAAAERVAEAKRKQSESAKKAKQEISVESIIERDIEKALGQLRSAKDNETTLINLKGVFSGDDLVEQFSSMVQKIAEQANLSVGKITVKDDIAQVRLYNEELKVTVEQMYKLRQATEEADSAQLELVSQSFSQNVKALNENTFDVDGFRARAVAAVEKVRSSLHGLEYDLTDLEKSAGNISSKEDFAKFNNQLKAAQDNIQAIKNATVSKSSMNQLANMQRDMKNANIELETMRIKLQKIGDIDGVEDAKKMIDDMALAAQKFNEAQDAQGQQDAYSKYSASRSSFKAQLEYLNAVKSFNASQASAAKQTVDPIKNQYNSILDTVNKINSINSDILKFQEKDAGSGLYSSYIKQLQAGKEQLVAQLQSTVQEIDAALSEGFVRGKEISIPSVKFLGDNEAVSNFLNSTKTQAALTADEIDRLVVSLQKAQSIDVQAAARVVEQFRTVQETYQKIGSLFSLDTNSTMYKNVEILFSSITKYRRMLSSDPTEWTPEQSKYLQTLIDEFNRYGNTLVQVGQKEQQYFAGKQKYTADTSMQSMAEDAKKSAEEVSATQQKLTTAAQNFAKESGASGAIVTNFVQGADGISRLDFSVLDSGTNSLRKFRMEMGSVSEGTYITETTVNNFVSKTQQAAKQLQTVSDLISRLQLSGANMDNNSIVRLIDLQQQLATELSKGSGADQNVLSRLIKDAKLSATEVEKLYKKYIQMRNAIASGDAANLGTIKADGSTAGIYDQLCEKVRAFAAVQNDATIEIGKFNKTTNSLDFELTKTDGTVTSFRASMDALTGSVAVQEIGTRQLGSMWQQLGTELGGVWKLIKYATVGYSVFFKVISAVRKGVNYVKEIDLALTELKKVTDETNAAYSNFLQTASKTSSVIGSTVSDFTEATANFARLGYSLEESSKMAETAIVYKNVADGLDTVEQSTESIISTMKAFGIESSDTMSIIDKFNEVKVSCLRIW